jgi:dihydrofolate reductase
MTNTVHCAMSLDGFIARKDHSIDFLESLEPPQDGEDYGWAEFFDPLDGMVMGRNTYDVVLGFKVWHYGDKKVMVLTTRDIEIPDFITGEVIPFEGTPEQALEEMKKRDCTELYIDGGEVVQQFLSAGLVDKMIIATIPILIGDGIPLFGELDKDMLFEVTDLIKYDNGLVMTYYQLKK